MNQTHINVSAWQLSDELLGDIQAHFWILLGFPDIAVALPVPEGGVRVRSCRRRMRHSANNIHVIFRDATQTQSHKQIDQLS